MLSKKEALLIKRKEVDSSNLKSIGYKEGILIVEFKNKNIYAYMGVSSELYNSLMKAESKGKYFNEKIRDKIEYTKIS